MNEAVKAIVVAGGCGRRLHLRRPKSSLELEGRSLIWWTVKSLRDAGMQPIDVFVDDAKWADVFRRQVCGPGVRVINDPGYSSTFILFREHCPSNGTCLFAYGHAPRLPQHYSALVTYDAPLVASVVDHTSRRHRITGPGGGLLEPPFLVRPPSVRMQGISSWQDFFLANLHDASLKLHIGLGEFNFAQEWAAYQAYLHQTLLSGKPGAEEVLPRIPT